MQTAAIGHNNPPSDKEIIAQAMLLAHGELLKTAATLANEEPVDVTDDITAGKAADLIKEISSTFSKVEKTREAEKSPYFKKGQAIDEFFKEYKDFLTIAKAAALKPLDAYQIKKAEDERKRLKEQEEALLKEATEKERLAKLQEDVGLTEAAEKTTNQVSDLQVRAVEVAEAAQAKPAELTRVSGFTSSTSLSSSWVGEIEDVKSVDLELLRPYLGLDALQKAVNALVKSGVRECKGVKIYQKQKSVVR